MKSSLEQDYKDAINQNAFLKARIEQLEEVIRHLQRSRYGTKSESLLHPGMKPLFEGAENRQAENIEPEEEPKASPNKRKASKRKSISERLIRETVYCDLPESKKNCPCCHEKMMKTHEKYSEKMHLKPPEFIVKKFVTPVYACKSCQEIKQANMPYYPIPKCCVTIETMSNIAIAKYLDGIPLHRQEKMFARHDVEVSRDTMSQWIISIADRLKPLANLLKKKLLESGCVAMDETYLQVLNEKNRRADQKSFFIVQAREGPPGQKIAFFSYEKSRATDVVARHLAGFKGALLTDGLGVYDSFIARYPDISHGGCLSHSRRKFADAVKGKKKNNSIAKQIILKMKELYRIESEIKGKSLKEIKDSRMLQSKPIVDEIETLLKDNIDHFPAKSLTGKALHYLAGQWPKLTRFITDPRLPMHNNYLEGLIRTVAMGRKAWLFSQSEKGAHASAIFFTLLITARENGLNPTDYLNQTLHNLGSDDLESLLPFA